MPRWCVVFEKDDNWQVRWCSNKDTLVKRVQSIGEDAVVSIIEINKEYDTVETIRNFLKE